MNSNVDRNNVDTRSKNHSTTSTIAAISNQSIRRNNMNYRSDNGSVVGVVRHKKNQWSKVRSITNEMRVSKVTN